AGRHDPGLRAEARIPNERQQPRREQRRPVPERAASGRGALGNEGLSGRHRRGRRVHRPDLRRAGTRVSRETRPSRARRRGRPVAGARVGGPARRGEVVHEKAGLERAAGGPARQRDETGLTAGRGKEICRMWEIALHDAPREMHSLLAALVVGRLDTREGPTQIVAVTGVSDNLYAVDAARGVLLWKKRFDHTS